MKPTTGYALPYSDDRCFFLNKELYAFFIQTHEEESFQPADITWFLLRLAITNKATKTIYWGL